MEQETGLLVMLIYLAIYLLPTVTAYSRKHHNAGAISLFNILLGWTGIGWVAALVWSATAVREERHA